MGLLTFSITCLLTITICKADFFRDLDKMDVDSQLKAIDKMLEKIDVNEEEALNTLMDKGADKAAEKTGDLFSNLFNTDCHFKCSDGSKPNVRKTHKPSFNGCGSFGLTFELEDLPEMTSCCNKHDICYDTCGTDREKCDDEFKVCLDKMCKKLKKGLSKKEYQGCKDMSKLMYTGTIALGCNPYLEGQKDACICKSEEKMSDMKLDKKPEVKTESKAKSKTGKMESKDEKTSSRKDGNKSEIPRKHKDEL